MQHEPVKFPHLSEAKSHEQTLNLQALYFHRLMIGVEACLACNGLEGH